MCAGMDSAKDNILICADLTLPSRLVMELCKKNVATAIEEVKGSSFLLNDPERSWE